MPVKWKCVDCDIVLSGEGASRHSLEYPDHNLAKLAPELSSKYTQTISIKGKYHYIKA